MFAAFSIGLSGFSEAQISREQARVLRRPLQQRIDERVDTADEEAGH